LMMERAMSTRRRQLRLYLRRHPAGRHHRESRRWRRPAKGRRRKSTLRRLSPASPASGREPM
jgi:hypothetical protein